MFNVNEPQFLLMKTFSFIDNSLLNIELLSRLLTVIIPFEQMLQFVRKSLCQIPLVVNGFIRT